MNIGTWIIVGLVTIWVIRQAYLGWKFVIWSDSLKRFNIAYPNTGVRVACVGDSITEGSSAGDINLHSYPVQLAKLLGNDYVVGNFGVSGATALNNGDRPYSKLKNALAFSKKFNPDIVLIMLGTNDSKKHNWNSESYKSDYKELIETYINLENSPRVMVVTPIPAFSTSFKIQPKVIETELINIVMEICKELEVDCINLNTRLIGKRELIVKDGIHPNKEGYKYIAEVLFDIIKWDKD